MKKNCDVCGREFIAKRSTAKYCCNRCRVAAQRRHIHPERIIPPPVNFSMTMDEVSAVIERAHTSAEDLSRASMSTEAPLSHKLGRCAKDFEESLRREGL